MKIDLNFSCYIQYIVTFLRYEISFYGFITCNYDDEPTACVWSCEASILSIKRYHYETDKQEECIDQYLEHAYLPALHKLGFAQVGYSKSQKQ